MAYVVPGSRTVSSRLSLSNGFPSHSSSLNTSGTSSPGSSIANLLPLTSGLDLKELRTKRCNAVIFDFGDVLFKFSVQTKTSIPPKIMKKILKSANWYEYEKGNITEQESYKLAASTYDLDLTEVARAFQAVRDSLRGNPVLFSFIRELKEQYGIHVFAMSNISAPDYEVLREKATAEEWALFERVFTSAAAHERKPNLGFYKYVLEETGVDPLRTVFIDDKLDNILPARSLGIKGIVYDSFDTVSRQLRNYCGDPIGRAQAWLKDNAKKMPSMTNAGVSVHENFTSLLIYEATGDSSLVEYVEHPRSFDFFIDNSVTIAGVAAFDLDTTSIGLSVSTHVDHETKMSVMDEMLRYVNKDGIIQSYFDPNNPRTDTIVCINVLTLFHMNGRGPELAATLDWVYSILKHRAYLEGTLYYHGGDAFLFFLSRLLSVSPAVYQRFAPLFAQRCFERSGAEGDALALAMRVFAGSVAGVRMYVDHERLLHMQEEDGAFPLGWMYKYGGSDVLIGNEGWTTALAMQACKAFEALDTEIF
ncbi:HAD-like protein [Phellopilus nigrolimitatus]|nr:HAD-like protein [Phellopilus nigrolimitatus]